ncbi:TPA: hypothetical protein ACPJ18_004144 [Vibrio alginolyticus]
MMSIITKEQIQELFLMQLMILAEEEHRGITISPSYENEEQAINKNIENLHTKINNFAKLNQDMIDTQNINHDGYLKGAQPGDLVWHGPEAYVATSIIEEWIKRASAKLNDESVTDIDDVAELVGNLLILRVLNEANLSNPK